MCISYELRNVYTIRRARWYVAGKVWKIDDVEVKIITFVVLDQVYHEVSATRSRTLFDLIFWLEDHFGSHKNFGSRGVSAAFAKYDQMFNSGGKHKFSVLRN